MFRKNAVCIAIVCVLCILVSCAGSLEDAYKEWYPTPHNEEGGEQSGGQSENPPTVNKPSTEPTEKPSPQDNPASETSTNINVNNDSNQNPDGDNTGVDRGSEEIIIPSKINLLITDWIGWKPIIDANGGAVTTPESIYGKMGIDVSITVADNLNPDSYSGEINAVACMINDYDDLLTSTPDDRNMRIVYIPVKSDGWNIMLKKQDNVSTIKKISIGIMRDSGADYLLSNDGPLDTYLKGNGYGSFAAVLYDSYEDAFKEFEANKLDFVCMSAQYYYLLGSAANKYEIAWDDSGTPPYDTAVYGVVAFDDAVLANKALVKMFVFGALKAEAELQRSDYTYVRAVLPSCRIDDNLTGKLIKNVSFIDHNNNIRILNNGYVQLQILRDTAKYDAEDLVEPYFLRVLHEPERVVMMEEGPTVTVTPEPTPKPSTTPKPNTTPKPAAATPKPVTVLTAVEEFPIPAYFIGNDSVEYVKGNEQIRFVNEAQAKLQLDKFINYANDEAHKGYKILIEGYIANVTGTDSAEDNALAKGRAQLVYDYLKQHGIDEKRLLTPIGKSGNDSRATAETSAVMRKVRVYLMGEK